MGVHFKRTLCALAGACAAFIATPSMAADTHLGTLQTGVATPAAGYLTAANPSDRIFFSLSATDDLASTVGKLPKMTIAVAPGLSLDFGLASLTADLFSAGGAFVGHLANLPGLTVGQSTIVTGLSAGDYFVAVSGTPFNAFTGGSYGLSLTATQAAAAPGPAGILFVGGAAALMAGRRRRQKAKQAVA